MASTTPTCTIAGSRYNEIVVLQATAANEDGDTIMRCSLPAGFGDCVILEIFINTFTFATIATNYFEMCASAAIVGAADGAFRDFIGATQFRANRGTVAAPTNIRTSPAIKPDEPVLWKESERVEVQFPELDTNAVPTADVEVYIKVQRLPARP